ncbi:MAG: DUF5686 family protein [Flavobacteriia bacterium]|nr:DUF5686 family protein [Flavobacteriia bacterium]
MKYFLIIITLLTIHSFSAQLFVRGVVTDENNSPIPNVKVYVKNAPEMRTLANLNGAFEISLMPGEYFLIFNALGFDEREAYISISDIDLNRNFQLFSSRIKDFETVDVSAKKANPGRDIMLKVVNKRDQINQWNYPHSVDVYIKATEKIEIKEREKKENDNREPSFEEKEENDLANKMNLVEVQLTRNYAPGNKVKEIRNAYTLRGSAKTLYYTTTVKSNFNFFQNLLHLDDLHQTPVSSPISTPGILSYRYKLESKVEENGQIISKIKISPRNTATTTLEGYIWVIDSLWLIQKLELNMSKGNLLVYDNFKIYQEYEHPGDSICILTNQVLTYGVKYKSESSDYKTEAIFSNYNFNPNFGNKFFSTELAITTKEAYEKDSLFWKENRASNLTVEEQRFIIIKDSIKDARNRVEYLDSVDAVFNKLTVLKVLWFGVDYRNRVKRTQWSLGSLATLIQPVFIAGPRITPSFDYFKKWKDERTLDAYTRISYGILNNDIKGDTWWKYKFDPFHFGYLRAALNHDFDVIRSYDAVTQVYKRENFIEATKMSFSFEYELINGLYLGTEVEFAERRSLKGYNFSTVLDNVIPNNNPIDFNPYQAFIFDLSLSYTPQQKYMREPYRKVLLGSAWPSFSLNYERGIPKLFGSDVDHEYLNLSINQTLKISTLGTTSYRIVGGKFLSSRALKDVDYKFQRRSDPIWFSNPMYSFQGLDSTMPTKDYIFEVHFIHHDNGSIINKIPFMKKTRIGLVFGGGAMYVKENDFQFYEIIAGLERNFKLTRRRLRVGIYGFMADGNKIDPKIGWKVSFAILNDRSMKYNF